MTCKDCIHFDVCDYHITELTPMTVAECQHFKSKADYAEVKHGEWGKEKWMYTDQHICSLCFSTVSVHPQSVEYKYCPYCGAKMDGKGSVDNGEE